MEPHHTSRLLSITLYVGIFFTLARLQPDQSSPESAPIPSPQQVSDSSTSAESTSPQAQAAAPLNYVSLPPSTFDPPSSSSLSNDVFSDPPSSDDVFSDPPSSDDVFSDPPSSSLSTSTSDDIFSDPPLSSSPLSDYVFSSESDSGGSGLDLDMSGAFASVKVDPQITKICDATDHPLLCTTTVMPLLKGRTDVKSVVQLTIDAGYSFSKLALSQATKLVEKPGNPPELISTLADCKDSYDTALYNYENAIAAFSENDIGTVNSMLSAVITFIGDCEDAFAGMGMESPLADYSEKLTNLTSNCLAVVSLMNQFETS